MIGVRPTISARLSAIPGTIGWTVTAQGTSARVRPVHTVVIAKPPIAEAAAAAGVVRGEVNPKSSGKKKVAPTMATAYETIARISAGVLSAAASEPAPIKTMVNRDTRRY